MKLLVATVFLFIISAVSVSSQDNRRVRRDRMRMERTVTSSRDSIPAAIDSIRNSVSGTSVSKNEYSPDTDTSALFVPDTLASADTVPVNKSSIDMPAFSAAKDSIIEDFTDGKRMIYYYGDVSVTYGNMKLSADYMEYDLQTGTVFARGTKDTSGVVKGTPQMEDGGKTYTMEEVRYNFNTRKARITNMITQEQDGILHGKNIKMMPDQSINITNGKYTVCDCEHPHYYLNLTSAKVMTKPSQKTVFGPAWPVIEDVPLFPVVLPFGFIPKRPDRATGFLMPTFGEETTRGFYFRDMGMYFVIGDYFDISLTGDLYTLGSWAVNLNSRYKVNYKCNGNFALSYSNIQSGEKGSSDFFQSSEFSVKWSHSQDSKARPGTTFTASVNFSSPSNNKYNYTSINEALETAISSSIAYSKNWNGKVNLNLNVQHSQNNRDSSYTFTLPNLTLNVTRFYPFKQKNRVGKEKFYEKFSLAYNTAFSNKISFKASEFNKPGFWDKFQNYMTHSFQIGLPSFTLFKYINMTPSVNYGMNWFFRKTEKYWNEETQKVESHTGGAFSSFGATHTYSGSLSMSTRLYGMFNFGTHHKIQAIRHVFTPSISVSLSPEKGTAFNGYRTLEYTDSLGVAHSQRYNIYEGLGASVPGTGKTASLSFSLGNNLEAKVRDMRDTTGTGSKKVKLLD
ncbi:MAG: putative LPS assembly protein LptD, partial [Candidatus Cryptobacteroides sp.]